MEKKARKKVLILIGIILGTIFILTILMSSLIENNDEKPSVDSNTSTLFKTEISRLENDQEFFRVEAAINDFYIYLSNQDKDRIYNILESSYKKENDITKNNILDKFEVEYASTSYIAKEIYYNKGSSVVYYFVNGYFIDNAMTEDNHTYNKNVNYLVIVGNGEYVIRPINTNSYIGEYASEYDLVYVDIKSGIKFPNLNISEKNKLIKYIDSFLTLMIYDNDRSYDMLSNDSKNKYSKVYFSSNIEEVYNKYSSSIFSYQKKESEYYNIYYIIDNKQNKITITEYNTMNYVIDLG